jgi:hypothetical protein
MFWSGPNSRPERDYQIAVSAIRSKGQVDEAVRRKQFNGKEA